MAARDNKDYVIKQVRHAIDDLSKVTMETGSEDGVWAENCGELAGAIDEFEVGADGRGWVRAGVGGCGLMWVGVS